ncbi:MAG TPA: heparan-alpha-glucosaminide N-acetyltransferase domain-containing protein [Thermoanaerobaculia bacterium]|nr:heparan-alpha-glucosaminide N-acetyltransferase domain-containing protein [Thermoanaerobaculia bacterium]
MNSQTTDNRPPTTRVAALDAFRGFTVAAMLLVNNPGTWSAIYWPLRHAEWHGWTPTDLIFPFFLFIVGITTELSRKEPLRILRRGALIILCGLLLHAFPYFRLGELRYMGVLQRIGIVYIIAALIAYKASRRTILAIAIAILLGYWAILTLGPLQPPEATIAAQVDRALISAPHLWKQAKTWDPEGPLSTLGAIGTALLGVLVTPWVRSRNVKMLTIAGITGIAIGLAWGKLLPINKNLWTSSYVVFTAGCACVVLALWIWKLPVRPFVVFGVNPLLAFLGSGVMARLLGIIKIDGVSLQALSYRTFFKPYFEPHLASLLWALAFVGIWFGILWVLYRKGIVLKV